MLHFRHLRRAPVIAIAGVGAMAGLALSPVASSAGTAHVAAPKLANVATAQFLGHGYGPGIGMGQWGDFGYAVRYHFTYERILNRYYGGTMPGTIVSLGRPANPILKVAILENLNLSTNIGFDPVITSPSGFTVTTSGVAPPATTTTTIALPPTTVPGATGITGITGVTGATGVPVTTPPPTATPPAPGTLSVPAGGAIDLRLQTNGTWNAYESTSCSAAAKAATTAPPVITGLTNPVVTPTSMSATAPVTSLLTLCRHDGVDEALRGQIEAYDRTGFERTLNLVPLESYLDAVVPAEESASWGLAGTTVGAPQAKPWGFQALEAQAVAARSYAEASAASGGWNGYADICDNTSCQAYVGANFENATSTLAVTDTAGEIRVTTPSATAPKSTLVSTRYSASTGGFTAPSQFPAVSDLGDACAVPSLARECNPNHTWHATIAASVITNAYKTIGSLLRLHVSTRNGHGAQGGRALTVVINGTKGSKTVSASAFSSAIGLRSDWFSIAKLNRVSTPSSSTTTSLPVATGTSGVTGVTGITGITGVTGITGITGAPVTTVVP